ncbi:MAG TPA: membrane protein insertase YidC [Stellaceae bacterium]|nr:membrane protein insertase YidC [Stellaceae bacterium]
MEEQQKNLFLMIALLMAILIGWQFFVAPYFSPPKPTHTEQQAGTPPGTQAPAAAPETAPPVPAAPPPPAVKTRAEALAESPRIRIETPKLHGSIALVGARLDDLTLATYHETVDPKSPEIELLSPSGTEHAYVVDVGWVATGEKRPALPTDNTRWTARDDAPLSPTHAVELTWDNGAGLVFTRRISVDDEYMFTVSESVANKSGEPVTLLPFGSTARSGAPPVSPSYLLHEGPIGVFDGTLKDTTKYTELKVNEPEKFASTGGWLGFTDKYWLTALIPGAEEKINASFRNTSEGSVQRYQADYTGAPQTVASGASAGTTVRIFAGAKEVKLLDRYESNLGITRFDRAIDFGWFYWITKPIFLTLDYFYGKIGNFGLAIMLLTLLIKIVFFPLANRSYRAMSKMKLLQPEIQKLREKFGEDKAKLNQEVMALYKRVGANPLAGCLPIFIQIPVFFSLYKVLYVTIEMRHAPFYGWIHDLSANDPTTLLNLFGLIPWDPTPLFALPLIGGLFHLFSLGAWALIMGVTMFLQQKLNPAPADPTQAKMMMALPVVFTFMLSGFPAGLVIYWSWNNTLSILQQWVIMHRAGAA